MRDSQDGKEPLDANKESLLQAWQESEHADHLDERARYSLKELRFAYESFNEMQLFIKYRDVLSGRNFTEIGCATGELYRYLREYHPDVEYRGFDISDPAISRARSKYPEGRFDLCKPDISDLAESGFSSSLIWSRDVVHHQPDPYAYLRRLLPLCEEVAILRLRTRDKGASVLDPEASCQWHYNQWVPYIVMNVDEVVDVIRDSISVSRIEVIKHYIPLGGWGGRYLPKACYCPETGTAETAVYIVRSREAVTEPEVTISARAETTTPPGPPLWLRGLRYISRQLT